MKTYKHSKLLLASLFYVALFGGNHLSNALLQNENADEDQVTYVGAVLEYAPYDIWTDEGNGLEIITINANAIASYAGQAKAQFADIFVAPEYGLHSLTFKRSDVDEFLTFTQYVPDPKDNIVPCVLPEDTSRIDAMRILSCAADALNMYVVIDVAEFTSCNDTIFDSEIIYWQLDEYESCPPEGYYTYNTQVVFNREGEIIARYRKIHLFLEDMFTPGPRDNVGTVFVTDFNVSFSLQICFDIVYTTPGYYNVKYGEVRDVIMGTAWVDELPFHTAAGLQNGWARGLGVNLLVSGYHNPFKSKMGSGIYRYYAKDSPNYIYNKDTPNVLLVSTVTTRKVSAEQLPHGHVDPFSTVLSDQNITAPRTVQSTLIYDGDSSSQHVSLQLDMSDFTTVFLDPLSPGEVGHVSACSYNMFCCDLTYQYSGNLSYALTVFSGQIKEGGGTYTIGVQIGSLAYCTNALNTNSCGKLDRNLPMSDTFGPFELSSSSFTTSDIFPSGLHRDLNLIDINHLNFESSSYSYKLFTNSDTTDIFGAALYGRWYSNDK